MQMLAELGPIMLLLEGGYNLEATAACTEACVRVLLGEAPPALPAQPPVSRQARAGILEALEAHAPHWQVARIELARFQGA